MFVGMTTLGIDAAANFTFLTFAAGAVFRFCIFASAVMSRAAKRHKSK